MLQRKSLRDTCVYMVDCSPAHKSIYQRFLWSVFFKGSCTTQLVSRGYLVFKVPRCDAWARRSRATPVYFCECHDSSIIVTCAKFRCGWIARMPTTVKFDLGCLNTLTPRHNYRHFTDDIFKCFFLNENVWISLRMSLKLLLKIRINNIPALLQIIVWRWLGDKPLSELMMVKLLTHKCVTRPLWVNSCRKFALYTYGNGITGQSYVLYVWCIGTPHSNLQ